jgi:hypothetical protein
MEKRAEFIPILNASGESLPEAWEKSIIVLCDNGAVYQRGDDEDPGNQLDAMMRIGVKNPDADPFAHMLGGTNAVGSPALDYMMEMLGAKSGWIKDFDDVKDTKWEYTYFDCLKKWQNTIDQLDWAVGRLSSRPFSRRTNLITWDAKRDTQPDAKNTPCLQRIWFNIIPEQHMTNPGLDMHYSFRSRNVMSASFGNMLGLYILGCDIRDKVEQATGKSLDMRMVDSVDSYHVNSKDYGIFMQNIKRIKAGNAPQNMNRADAVDYMKTERTGVESAILKQTEKYFKGDMHAEEKRVKEVGDRIFYLLDKYKPID